MPLLRNIILYSKLDREIKNILAEELFSVSKEDQIIDPNITITKAQAERFKNLEKKIRHGLAFQYAIGKSFFYGYKFFINQNVLIPCPETEILVEKAIKLIGNLKSEKVRLLDIGTGSGVIPATIFKDYKDKKISITASDISKKALKVAEKNFKSLNVHADLIQSDLFKNVHGKFNIVTANLPYGSINDPDYKNLPHPDISTIGGQTGFEIIGKCLRELDRYLEKEGVALFEIGYDQRPMIQKLFKELKHFKFKIFKDFNEYDRVLVVSWRGPHSISP